MSPQPRYEAWRRLAAVMERQLASVRSLDLAGYTASQAELEAACLALRQTQGTDFTPLDRAWAGTVRRLSRNVQEQVHVMRLPWNEVVHTVAARSAGRASPVGLDCRA